MKLVLKKSQSHTIIHFWNDELKMKLAHDVFPAITRYDGRSLHLSEMSKTEYSSLYSHWVNCTYEEALPIIQTYFQNGVFCWEWRFIPQSSTALELFRLPRLFYAPHLIKTSYTQLEELLENGEICYTLETLMSLFDRQLSNVQKNKFILEGKPFLVDILFPAIGKTTFVSPPGLFLFFLLPKFLETYISNFPEIFSDILFYPFLQWVNLSDSSVLRSIL